MAREYRKPGDLLFLELQLGDGGDADPNARVFADIRRPDNTVLTAEFEIPVSTNGAYREETQVMPTEPSIIVTYYVRRTNGVTPSNRYSPNYISEVFLRDVTGEIIESNLDKKISEVKVFGPVIEGSILTNQIIEGTIEQDQVITGEVQTNQIIEGTVYEC